MSLISIWYSMQLRYKNYLNEIAVLRNKEKRDKINRSKKYRRDSRIAHQMYYHVFINLDASMALLKRVSQYNTYYKSLIMDDKVIVPIEEMLYEIEASFKKISKATYLQSFPEFQEKLLNLSEETLMVNHLIQDHKSFDEMGDFGRKRIDSLVRKYENEVQGFYAGFLERKTL